jgi:hypothetical protein
VECGISFRSNADPFRSRCTGLLRGSASRIDLHRGKEPVPDWLFYVTAHEPAVPARLFPWNHFRPAVIGPSHRPNCVELRRAASACAEKECFYSMGHHRW